ncbi:MAG: HlyD family type I secretion periplasmic adaptor subunit [Pseudomonadota bacterium]
MKPFDNKELTAEMQARDGSAPQVDTDSGRYSKLGWLMIVLGVGGFLAWAALAPLDKGVPLAGTVVKESNRKAIAHQSGGIIDAILVHEGDAVKAGQVLVRMNETQARAQAETVRVQYYTARAIQARLVAERDGAAALAPYDGDDRARAAFDLQVQLFASRRSALHSELAAIDENIAGIKLQADGIRASLESKKEQQSMLREQVTNLRALAAEGYVPRSRLLDLERGYAQLSGSMAEDNGNIGRAQRQVAEMSMRRLQRSQEFQKEVRSLLSDTQREAGTLGTRLVALDYELANLEVKAPVGGVVVGLNVFTQGGVIAPGARMMDLVPSADALVVEGRLAVNLVDKVHPGLPVELNFSAFNASHTPHIAGAVLNVSADRMVDERSGEPYYKMKVRVTPEGLKQIARLKLAIVPGMPVDLFVRTGERTMMSYLFKPLADRAKTALTED